MNNAAKYQENIISSVNQNEKDDFIYRGEGSKLRILFVGNSITLHGYRPQIGWFGEWGMAASSIDKDYAHLLMKKVREKRDAEFCICQVSEWETTYKNGESVLEKYDEARDFSADVIVFRAIENCSSKEFEPELFKSELIKLLDYLGGKKKAQIILTTGVWRHPAARRRDGRWQSSTHRSFPPTVRAPG